MFIAVIIDEKLWEIKKTIDKKNQKEHKSEIDNELLEKLPDDQRQIISPLVILQQALEEYDNQIEYLIPNENLPSLLQIGKFDLIFNTAGKSATQNLPAHYIALFDLVHVPFIGSPMDSVSICKNKALFKSILQLNFIATPRFQMLKIQGGKLPPIDRKLKYPLLVKFFYEGIHQDEVTDQLAPNPKALSEILTTFTKKVKFSYVMIEEVIQGRKIYLPIIGNDLTDNIQFLPALEYLLPENTSLEDSLKLQYKDLNLKFLEMTEPLIKRARKVAHKAYNFCNCRDFAMAVFLVDEKTQNLLLHEINPLTSLLPDGKSALAANHIGIEYSDFLNDIILNALLRYDLKIRGKYSKRLKIIRKISD
ncbi:hypothetical protein [Candidatus Lokiarchaeum ossiferum]|uniref:hypothetical protein n=1 Tax=Candidatus Lokiarchaeum ossiferum TaxID=2951803 RepID=UPI00352DBEA2